MRKLIFFLIILVWVPAFMCLFYGTLNAKVTGVCSNCHTMHNSQNGTLVALQGPGVAWTGGPDWELAGGSSAPSAGLSLVISDCVGCHSCNTAHLIVELGGTRIPIVYNVLGLADNADTLAGGNFCWVETKGDAYGHNVLGISDQDDVTHAPGGSPTTCLGSGCHITLVTKGAANDLYGGKGGCEGCHYHVSHHETRVPLAYRFLYGHDDAGQYVIGKEDPDWEAGATSTKHNEYKGHPNDSGISGASVLSDYHNMSSYCKGCHGSFHVQTDGTSWIRHPSDAVLPETGEYAAYVTYDPMVPVARPDPMNVGDPSIVNHGEGGDMVMCLSCHRAHGSPYPDMLRWDYEGMIAGTTGATAGTGCFICHTSKDGQ